MSGYIIALLTIFASAIGFYVTASFNLAQKQLMAATRLQAYLLYYARIVFDLDIYKLFYLGEEWDKEEQALLQRGGTPQELLTLSQEKKKLIEQLQNSVKNPDIVPDSYFQTITETICRFTDADLSPFIDLVKSGRQNMLTGQTFITDEEASFLGTPVATNAIAFKMGLIELMDGFVYLLARSIRLRESLDAKEFANEVCRLLWRAINVSRHYSKLRRACGMFTSSSVVGLTLRNIRQGSRITGR